MRFDLQEQFDEARDAAVSTIRNGGLIVLPTDTVYGIGADAFNPLGVKALLEAKGRSRAMPPPVLIGDVAVLDALTVERPPWLDTLLAEMWPGALTVICRAQPSLAWDLGDTRGTVAVRVPDHDTVRDLLRSTGPLAVSSANLTGQNPVRSAEEAEKVFGERVGVYLHANAAPAAQASTVLDATGVTPKVLRAGPVTLEELHRFNNTIVSEVADA